MIKDLSLPLKLTVFVLLSIVLIFGAAFGYSYVYTKASVLSLTQQSARNLVLATARKLEVRTNGVEKVINNMAVFVSRRPPTEEQIIAMLKAIVADNPEIFGSIAAFRPYGFSLEREYFAPYAWRPEGSQQVQTKVIGGPDYKYFYFDWYQIPKELERPDWSEPYFDKGGSDSLLATYSVPFFREEEGRTRFLGVMTADISLKWLTAVVSSTKIAETGYAFLISKNGTYVAHPRRELVMRESIFSVAEARKSEDLREIGRDMIQGHEGMVRVKNLSDKDSWLYYAPVGSTGWTLGVVFPEDELFAGVRRLSMITAAIALAGFMLIALAVVLIAGRVTRPLKILSVKSREIAKGNLEIDLPKASSRDEIGDLTQSFEEMKGALKEYITNLAATTAAKERIESELKIASTIQMSFLPKKFPPFPDKKSFDLYARIHPAKEVGGDLYDFFLLGEDELFFAIGDVSGKGVPGALFMAVTKTLLKGTAEPGIDPGAVLSKVNNELCLDNDSCMFVTAFCGSLNYRTGELAYANAGHNPPILVSASEGPNFLNVAPGFVLGIYENTKYETRRMVLGRGQQLLLYTDGVTEAENSHGEFYSEQRFLDVVKASRLLDPQELVDTILTSVKIFAGDFPQSDDITVMSLRFKG